MSTQPNPTVRVYEHDVAAETARLSQRLSAVHAEISRRIDAIDAMIRRLEGLPFVPPDHPLPWRIDAERQRAVELRDKADWAARPFFDCLHDADPVAYGLFMDLKERDLLTVRCSEWLHRTFARAGGLVGEIRAANAEVARRLDAIESGQ
jgi:hypothetical protein